MTISAFVREEPILCFHESIEGPSGVSGVSTEEWMSHRVFVSREGISLEVYHWDGSEKE
jgi:hypothetical protein